jgi:hypothetical protein
MLLEHRILEPDVGDTTADVARVRILRDELEGVGINNSGS